MATRRGASRGAPAWQARRARGGCSDDERDDTASKEFFVILGIGLLALLPAQCREQELDGDSRVDRAFPEARTRHARKHYGERFVDMNITALFWGSLFPSSCVPSDTQRHCPTGEPISELKRTELVIEVVWFRVFVPCTPEHRTTLSMPGGDPLATCTLPQTLPVGE